MRAESTHKINGIRGYEIDGETWYLLEDVRQVLRKPRLTGIGPAKYICFDRGPWITVRRRLVTAEAVLEYMRIYSEIPIREWKRAFAL